MKIVFVGNNSKSALLIIKTCYVLIASVKQRMHCCILLLLFCPSLLFLLFRYVKWTFYVLVFQNQICICSDCYIICIVTTESILKLSVKIFEPKVRNLLRKGNLRSWRPVRKLWSILPVQKTSTNVCPIQY